MDAEAAVTDAVRGPRPRSRRGTMLRWLGGLLAALLLALGLGALVLDSPLGERFIASRIAAQTFPSGLNIRIGRIEGNLYGASVLHDVQVSDPKGVFLVIPRAEVDWNPRGWLRNRLDIRTLTARRAKLSRLPAFNPSTADTPILPGFDIAIGRFEIDNLMLAPGVAGPAAQRVDLTGKARVDDRRLMLKADARLGRKDRFAIDLDARPDSDDFKLALDVAADRAGPLVALAGLDGAYTAALRGKGSWRRWNGALLARSDGRRVAALRVTNRDGRFGVLGLVSGADFTDGLAKRALGPRTALNAEFAIADRVITGAAMVVGQGAEGHVKGRLDLARNRVDRGIIALRITDPALLSRDLRIAGGALDARITGPLGALEIVHEARAARLAVGTLVLDGVRQRGTARLAGGQLVIPLDVAIERASSGQPWLDPRLRAGTLRGQIVQAGNRLTGRDLRLAFPGLSATLALAGDPVRGRYRLAGPVRAEGLRLDNVGTAAGTALIELALAKGTPWRLAAQLDARVAPVANATLANLAGPSLRLRGAIGAGGGAPLTFSTLRVDGARLTMTLNGALEEGTIRLAGRGRQSQYGPFTVSATLADGRPSAVLAFEKPMRWLDQVRLAIVPRGDAFALAVAGGSVLGPFTGDLTLTAPRKGPTRIAIERLRVSDTAVTGALSLEQGGARGTLALAGGGLDGTVALTPQGDAQALAVRLTARQARFGGQTPLTIARGDLTASGTLRSGHSSFAGEGNAQGVSFGALFIGRIAAKGALRDGRGRVDASLSGQRGSRFDLDLNALVEPGQLGLAARGEYAGKRILTPRRAILTRLDEGGWSLAPALVSYGSGGVLASGRFGGAETALDLRLAGIPLSLLDLIDARYGLGGTMSGVVEYRQPRFGLPSGRARVQVAGLTRSGLLLTSQPMRLSLVAALDADSLDAQAKVDSSAIRRGRLSAQITGLPASGRLAERLRMGRLAARLNFNGAAESLWRLAAVNAFDLTGPVAISAEATGTIADPVVRGAVASDALRIASTISGTDIRGARVRGRFEGSRLRVLSFAGSSGSGTVSGSGEIDLAGLGERVEGPFVSVRGPKLDLRVSAKAARLLDAGTLGATVTGPLRIVSDGLGGTIAGRLRVDRAKWVLGRAAQDQRLPRLATREINVPADRAPDVARARPWRYLIDAQADDRVDVDGMGLDSEWAVDIRLRGTTEDPRVGGRARMVRGDYTFSGTRFELSRGEIAFDQAVAIDPRLDIRAESTAPGLDVTVRVTGSASAPEIAFSSNPSLPEEEILARLLFGGSITTLSATDALQLGAAVASLRGGAGIDPINRLRSAIGLDRLRIVSADPALGRGTGIAIGKNITRRLYVELVTDGKGYSATDLEFRVTSWLSLLASVSTIGRESAVAEISRDY